MGVAYPGQNVNNGVSMAESFEDCKILCGLTLECKVFTYITEGPSSKECSLKTSKALENKKEDKKAISGVKSCTRNGMIFIEYEIWCDFIFKLTIKLPYFRIIFFLYLNVPLTEFKEERSRNKCYYYHRNVPGNNHALCLDKTDSAKDCHELCYYTKDCAQFIWFDKSFQNGLRYKDCCMKNNHSNYYVYAEGAISGHKYCGDTYDQGKIKFVQNSIELAVFISLSSVPYYFYTWIS